MISIEDCRKLVRKTDLTDEQIRDLRDAIYAIAENVIDQYIQECNTIEEL